MTMMRLIPRVREFMTAMPQCIPPDEPLVRARQRMAELHAHHLPVTVAGELVGLVTEHDLDELEIAAKRRGGLDRCTVAEAMHQRPVTCGPDAHLHAVAAEMAVHNVDSAVIVDPDHPGHVLGVFTATDALHALSVLVGHEEAQPD